MAIKKKFKPEYSVDEVLGLYRTRVTDEDEARLRTIVPVIRDLCRLKHEVKVPDAYKAITKEVRTPFMRDSLLRIASSLVGRKPVAHITPKKPQRKEYREAANIAERWDAAAVERFNRELGSDIDFENAAALVRDGDSILKVVHRPDAWANFPERGDESAEEYSEKADDFKKGVDLPIAWRNVDRLCIVREGGEYGDGWVLEYGEYARPYLRSRYGMREADGRLVNPKNFLAGKSMPEGLQTSATGKTIKVEFWTPSERHVIVDGIEAPGFPKPNPYAPYLPYFPATAYDMESLLYSLVFLVPRMDELLTMKLNWAVLGAYPNPVSETVPNPSGLPAMDMPVVGVDTVGSGDANTPIKWAPGKHIDLPVGKKLSFLAPPPVGKDLNDLVVIFKSLIDVAGIPSIMRGMAGSGDSGYLANQMLAAVQMAYQLATLSLQRQRSKAMDFNHWLVGNKIKQTVYVLGYSELAKNGKPKKSATELWLGLGDKPGDNIADVGMLGPVSNTYRPTLPTDAQANAMIALQLTNSPKPLLDRLTALEELMQQEDGDAILDALWVEEALNSEPLRQMQIDEALRDAGYLPQQPPANTGLTPILPGMQGAAATLDISQIGPGNPTGGPAPAVGSIPLQGMPMPGGPTVPGLNQPIVPGQPAPQARGVPGAPGGRPPGSYPGQPGGA